MRWITCGLLTVVLGLATAPSQAQVESKRLVSIGFGGGMSVPVSDAGDAFKNGFNVQGFARLNLKALPIAPRFDLNYQKFDLDPQSVAGVVGTNQILAGLANVQINLMPGAIRPYVLAGLGAYSLKTETTGLGGTSQSDIRFGINGGAGLVLKLGAVSAYIEGRVDNVFTEKGLIAPESIQVVPVTFGVVF